MSVNRTAAASGGLIESLRIGGLDGRRRLAALARGMRWWTAALFLAAASLLCAEGASAHAVLKKIEPSDGALLDAAPKSVVLTMNEDVSLISAKLFDSQGAETPLELRKVKGQILEVGVAKDLTPGDFLFSYRITSGDGHPVFGAVQFRLLGGKERASLAELRKSIEQDIWRTPMLVIRVAHYAALMAAAGGALLVLFIGVPAPARVPTLRYVRLTAATGVATGVLLFGAGGAELGGLGYLSLFTGEPWSIALDTSNAVSALLATLGLALVIAASLRPLAPEGRDAWWAMALGGSLMALLSFAASGHVATAEPRWLMAIIVALHVVAAAYWLGALYPLLLSVRLGTLQEGTATVKRFSALALGAVGLLLAAGVIMSWVQLQNLEGFSTAYGWRLAIKLVFVALLLGVAVLNKAKFTVLLERGVERGRRLLSAALRADLALALGVLFATAALNLDAPPRNLNMHSGELDVTGTQRGGAGGHGGMHNAIEFALNAKGSDFWLKGAVSPVTPSVSKAAFTLLDKEGKTLPAIEAALRLSNPDKGIEALSWKAAPASDGSLRIDALKLPFPGKWQIEVDVVIDDFNKAIFAGEVKIDTTSHGDEVIDSEGSLLNANWDTLPKDCPKISRDVNITVKTGTAYAAPGQAYGYDRNEWEVPGCARVTVTLINEDEVRHQFMVHGLPKYVYPMGMFHIEANGGSTRSGTFIVASSAKTLLVHCDIAHHMEKGLKGQIKVAGGTGNLPSVPGVTAARAENLNYGWGVPEWLAVMLGTLGGAALAFSFVRLGRGRETAH